MKIKHINQDTHHLISAHCGAVFKKIRMNKGMSGKQLAKKLYISQQQVSRYERGNNKITIDLLFHIANELDISIIALLRCVILDLQDNNSILPSYIQNTLIRSAIDISE